MTSQPFTTTSHQITASILSADFARTATEIDDVLVGGVDFLHLDIMDGHFVPNISFGPHMTECVRAITGVYLDAHLMISEPLRYAAEFVKAGASNLTFHVESVADPVDTAKRIHDLGCNVGITARPGTALDLLWPALDHVDVVLVMSVEPGFSGQKFMPQVLEKVRAIRPRLRPEQRLEIDGGINPQTIIPAAEAGVDWFVVSNAIFGQPDRAAAIAALRKSLAGVNGGRC